MYVPKNNRMTILATLALFAIVISGCRNDSHESITLTIWSSPTHLEEKNFLEICKKFEEDHPGIAIHNVGGLQETKLIRALVAGVPPDLVYMYNPTLVGPLAANHAIENLDNRFKASGLQEAEFFPGAISQLRMKGKLFAMPICRDCRAFFWNKTDFRQAGLDPESPPKTMEALEKLAIKLTKRDESGKIVQLGMQPPLDNALLFSAFGGGIYDTATDTLTLNSIRNVETLKWLIHLVDAMGGHDAVAAYQAGFGNMESAQNPLATGAIAMQIEGEYVPFYLERYAPSTDYGVGQIPYPTNKTSQNNMAWQDGDVLMLPAGSKHPDAAWEFMKWMQQPAQQKAYAIANRNLPTILSLVHEPELIAGSSGKSKLGYIMQKIAINRKNTKFFPTISVARLCKDVLNNAVELAELHRKSPEQALADAQLRVQREMEKYNR